MSLKRRTLYLRRREDVERAEGTCARSKHGCTQRRWSQVSAAVGLQSSVHACLMGPARSLPALRLTGSALRRRMCSSDPAACCQGHRLRAAETLANPK